MIKFSLRIYLLFLCNISFCAADTIQVLFLSGGGGSPNSGHNGRINHHKLIPSFLRSNIDLEYSSDLNKLQLDILKQYDALILYLEPRNDKPERLKALIDYVNQGGGLVGVHNTCAGFEGEKIFVELIGGQFKSHGSGWFTAKHVKGCEDHPALGGIPEFEVWDETYVHKNLNKDRKDLQYRDEKGRQEPWTWIREQGKGRVFYTAYGHDGRAWGHRHFQRMITAATLWVSKRKEKFNHSIPKITYTEDKNNYLHNYEKRRDAGRIQNQLTPQDSSKCIVLPNGFEAQLIAHEPDIVNPIDMTWDDRGRLYVAETVDYPLIQEDGGDRIKLCEDTNGDGVMDKFTVFAEGFSIHTGICWVNGGLILAQAPNMYFLKDTDGDDKADLIKKINSGWGTGDLHGGPSNLKYSFDNKIYGCLGGGGYQSKNGHFSSGIWRMEVDGSQITPISNLGDNSWALGISEDFEIFASSANKGPAKHIHVPYPYFDAVGLKKVPARSIFDFHTIYPITITRQGDHFGSYTAGTSFELYTARSFPKQYWNKSAFIGSPTGKLLGQFFLEPDKSGSYIARNKGSLLASFDERTAPIQGKTGPDGHLYMLDWHNLIMMHGGQINNPLRDKSHGRIYRIVYKEGKPSKILNLHKATTKELLKAYSHENLFWRMMAQQKIVQQKRTDAIPQLIEMSQSKSLDAIGSNPSVIHALWSLHGLGQLNGSNKEALQVAQLALKHPSAAVRKNAIRVLPITEESTKLLASMLKEKDLNTLRHILLTLSLMPSSSELGQKLYQIKNEVSSKEALRPAFQLAFVKHGSDLVKSFIAELPERDFSKKSSNQKKETQLKNIMINSSFEKIKDNKPIKWIMKTHKGVAKLSLDHTVSKTGNVSARIESNKGGGAEFLQIPLLKPGEYLLSAWIKTKNITGRNGVLLKVAGRGVDATESQKITGSIDKWKKLQLNFRVKQESGILIYCLFGAWSNSTGTVWFDDIELFQLTSEEVVKKATAVESLLTKQVFEKGAKEIIEMVKLINTKREKESHVYMEGLSDVQNISFNHQQINDLKKYTQKATEKNKMILAIFASNNNIDIGLNELANSIKGFEVEILKGDANSGKTLSKACVICHGDNFEGKESERSPSLAQLSDWSLQTQLQKFKHNVRGSSVEDTDGFMMKSLMQVYTHQQIADLSAYIRTHDPKKKSQILNGDPKKGKALYQNCVACHQPDAKGLRVLKAPRLKGLSDTYIVKQLKNFKSGIRGSGSGDRSGKLMQSSAKILKNEQEMKDVAAYILSLE